MSSSILGPEWNLSPEGLNIVTQNGALKDAKSVLKQALDSDLKITGKPALANELSKSRLEKIVLQIQKIRNISAPKAKEESQAAPRMLKLTLTDGESYVQAIEMTPINSISREKTAPGTKVLINGASVVSGYLLISPQNFTVLGGQVEHLYDKWVLAKSIQHSHQYGKVLNEGAPPWVAFGGKIITGNQDRSFKSLEKSKDGTTDTEFEQQRKDAIAEASTGAVRKTFGGRVKQNVQPIQNNQHFNKGGRNGERENDRGRRGKFAQKDDEVEKLQRPSEKVSLFSFLEDKLPLPEPKKPIEQKSQFANSYNKPSNQNYSRDPRTQPRSEGHYNRYENKAPTKPQFEKDNNSTYQRNERPSNQQNYNSNSSKQSISESVNSSTTKNLPQKSNTSSNIPNNPKFSSNDSSNSNSIRKNADVANNVNNYNPRYSQQNQYKNNGDNYPQQPNVSSGARDNYSQPQSGYYNNPRQQRWEGNDSNRPHNGPQYPNTNSYQQPNNQYNQKPPQNYPQNTAQNAEMHVLANNLSKMSVSNEFASRSLRQHLNLGPPKKQEVQGAHGIVQNSLNVGDPCMARYWEDGKFYPATVAAITDKTYAVQFTGYGNIEEVLKHDCFSSTNSFNQHNRNPNFSYPQNNFSGTTMEFRSRRGPPRN